LLPEIERNTGYAIRNGGVGRVWIQKHYGLKESEARWVVEYFADPEKPKPEPLFTAETRYEYDAANDVYVITSRSGREIEAEGNDIRDIRRKYSNWTGDYDTVKEIAFDYAHISLRDVKEILFAMDIIHDSSPFTDEEIAEVPREELIDELTRLEKVKVAKQWEKKRLDEQRKKAIDFDLMEIRAKARRKGLIDDLIKVVPSVTRHDPQGLEPTKGYVVVVQPADIHFGKLGTLATTGSEYNRTVCYNAVIGETDLVLSRATALGTPDAIHLTVAHDWFHIDSYWKTTTKGTPQDIDGSPLTLIREGKQLAVDLVERCLAYAPKVVINAALSNHDLMHGASLLDHLEAWYHNDDRVEVITSLRMRQYYRYGNTLVGITHGHGPKQVKDLSILMAQEAPELWGKTKFREIFTGHIHHHKSIEVLKDIDHKGIRVWTLPSLSGTDQWHEINGFVKSVRSVQAHLISAGEGHIGFFAANIVDAISDGFDLSKLIESTAEQVE
jgi:hypothetical protein